MAENYKILSQEFVQDLTETPGVESVGFVALDAGQEETPSNTAAYSTDGITWTQTTMPSSDAWFSVTYGDGTFAAIAYYSSTAAYSTDGITWTQTTMPASTFWRSVTYGDGTFAAVASFTTTAAYSTDGITWTQTTMPASVGWQSVTYGDGTFAAIASSTTTAAYSTDAITWTQTTMPASVGWRSVTYGDGTFAAVAYGTTTAAYSTDAITWTQTTMPASVGWQSVTYGENDIIISTYDPKTIYTVPANTETAISSISVINNGTVSGDYYLGVVKSEDSSTPGISNTQTIIPNKTLAAGAIDEIFGGITLSAGDQIRIFSESPDITAHIYGVKLS